MCNEIKKKRRFYFFEAQFAKDQDQRNYIVSNDKIEKTGFKPTFSLTDGIIELIKGFTMLKNSKIWEYLIKELLQILNLS